MVSNNRVKSIHRLRHARTAAGVSMRSMTARTGMPASMLRDQEESPDVPLSDFLKWQRALCVPFEELLEPYTGQMADHIRVRAGLVRLMKSVKSLYQDDLSERQEPIVKNIVHQLEHIMPELNEVEAWPQFGPRRAGADPARIEVQMVDTTLWCPELNEA